MLRDSGGFGLCAAPPRPKDEVLELVARNGDTAETIRELIVVPLEVQAHWRAYVRAHPEDTEAIEAILHFRRRVLEEFEKLVAGKGRGVVRETET